MPYYVLTLGDQMSQARMKMHFNFLELQVENPAIDYTGLQKLGSGLGLEQLRQLLGEYMDACDLVLSPGPRFDDGDTLWYIKKMLNIYFGLASGIGPPAEYGPNLVSNSNFNTATDWNISMDGWSISGGNLRCDGTQTADTWAWGVAVPIVTGLTYRITFDVFITAGSVVPFVSGAADPAVTPISTTGTYSIEAIAQDDQDLVQFKGDADFEGVIGYVVVQEKLSPGTIVQQLFSLTMGDRVGNYGYRRNTSGNLSPMDWFGVEVSHMEARTSDRMVLKFVNGQKIPGVDAFVLQDPIGSHLLTWDPGNERYQATVPGCNTVWGSVLGQTIQINVRAT